MREKTLLVIAGPTASGKTALSIKLAKALHTEIISADSRQFYKELSIGTAKPTAEELRQAVHHFISNKSILETYSAGDFEKEALAEIERLFLHHDTVIMTGGSGLYIDAVCKGFDELPETKQVREGIIKSYKEKGISWLIEELEKKDPHYLAEVDRGNSQRLMRALEVYEATGIPFSQFRKRKSIPRPFRIVTIALNPARADLYERINARVDEMMAAGLENEARENMAQRSRYALRTVGYAELFDYFDGITTLEQAVELIKQHTRNFAKRQITWLKRNNETIWIDPMDEKQIFAVLKERGIL
jgi:tRNA dimethylallyltransferase